MLIVDGEILRIDSKMTWKVWIVEGMDRGRYGSWKVWIVEGMDRGRYGSWKVLILSRQPGTAFDGLLATWALAMTS